MSLPSSMSFTVSIPSMDGFLGRECNNPACRKYFKIHINSMKDEMYCPYCGEIFGKDELWSSDQIEYAKNVAKEEVMELLHREISDMFKKAFSGSKYVTFKQGSPYQKKRVVPPVTKEVDTELTCPACKSVFQVYGIFGYCPVCRSENILLYDANWAIIKQEIRNDENHERALRHAYGDLVSTFESFCRKRAERLSIGKGRFQNIEHTRRQFKEHANIDIYSGLSQADIRTIRRVFEKRNVAEHNNGIINERYIEQIPEDRELLGTRAIMSIEELESAARILKTMLDKLLW